MATFDVLKKNIGYRLGDSRELQGRNARSRPYLRNGKACKGNG